MSVVLIIIVIAVLAVSFVFPAWYKAKQLEEGNMIQRDNDFVEYGEIFSLKHVEPEKIAECIENIEFEKILGGRPSGDTSKMIFNANYGFSAQLCRIEDDGESMKYRFDFLTWETIVGKRASADAGMNLLLTAIEKMFLTLDPETKVSKEKNDTKRKFI